MRDFNDSLSPTPEDNMDKDQPCASDAMTITDMDSGDLHPLDHSACDEPSLSSCDMWDDGRGFLDNLLEELCDLSSDEWTPQDSCFDLDDFVS